MGALPVDGTTQYVDGSYGGGDADGSEARPWPTIGQGVSAVAPGGLIAVAAGSYGENLFIQGKPVRLWGVCPEQVAIVGTGPAISPCPLATVCLANGADGTEVGGVAIVGPGQGFALSGSQDVLLDRIWLHDAGARAIGVEDTVGPTSITIRDSLVEQNQDGGLLLYASVGTLEGSVVRTSREGGIEIGPGCRQTSTGWQCDSTRASLRVTGSLIEQNDDVGLEVSGSDLTMDSSVVRSTQPQPSTQQYGVGLHIQHLCLDGPSGPECDPTRRATARVTRSLLEQNHDAGVTAMGSDLSMDCSVVRDTLPRGSDHQAGRGLVIQVGCSLTPTGGQCDPEARANASVTRSLIERNHEVGMFICGADAAVDSSVVRSTLPRASNQGSGRGINVQHPCPRKSDGLYYCDPAVRSRASLTRLLIDQSHEHGLVVITSDVTVDSSVVRGTLADAADGSHGDGITVFTHHAPAAATITNTVIADSARAGLASFGAFASIANTRIQCAAFELNGEFYDDSDFEVVDAGRNSCGCPTADGTCLLVSAGLVPPEPLGTD